MKHLVALAAAWVLILLAIAPTAGALAPVISVTPGNGEAGSTTLVIGSGFVGGVPVEIHAGSKSGPLLGNGTASGGGIFGIEITIPNSAAVGTFTIYACGSCSSELHDEATTSFQVNPPPTTTPSTSPPVVTTSPPTTEPPPPPPPPGTPCDIPEDAHVITFEEDYWPLSGPWQGSSGLMKHAGIPSLYEARWDWGDLEWTDVEYHFVEDPVYPDTYFSRVEVLGMETSSPEKFAGIVGPGQFRLIIADRDDPAQSSLHRLYGLHAPDLGYIDYFGFNVGWGVADRNLPIEDTIDVELAVHQVPFHDLGTGVTTENDWGSVRVTLGPGPQSIVNCLMIEDPDNLVTPVGTYIVELSAYNPDGTPLYEFSGFEIDDIFFGVEEDLIPPLLGEPPEPDEGEPEFVADIGEPPPDPSDLPMRLVFLGLGVLAGALGLWAFRPTAVREEPRPPEMG